MSIQPAIEHDFVSGDNEHVQGAWICRQCVKIFSTELKNRLQAGDLSHDDQPCTPPEEGSEAQRIQRVAFPDLFK